MNILKRLMSLLLLKKKIFQLSRNIALLILLPVFTSACNTQVKRPEFPMLSWSQAPILLNVASIGFNEEYYPPLTAPNVEHLFPLPLGSVVESWSQNRINATHHGNFILKITVKEASVIETELPLTLGITGWFTKDQSELYKATLDVLFEVFKEDEQVFPVSEMRIKVANKKSISEDESIHDKEYLYYEMTKELINTLNDEFEKGYRHHLSRIVHLGADLAN